jgi:hypothetical protein
VCECDKLCIVTFILQGCVFEYKRVDAILQRTVMNDAMVDVIKAGMRKRFILGCEDCHSCWSFNLVVIL